jgi:hypothetical protein
MGFAPRCEAVAMPRRRGAFYILGYALGLALTGAKTSFLTIEKAKGPRGADIV